jgi:hypothetical protein
LRTGTCGTGGRKGTSITTGGLEGLWYFGQQLGRWWPSQHRMQSRDKAVEQAQQLPASQAAIAANKTAIMRAQSTEVVLQPDDGRKASGEPRFFDDWFAHRARSATDAESEMRFTPRPSYRL